MASDYKLVFKMLYDNFGDELVDFGKSRIKEKLQDTQSKNKADINENNKNDNLSRTSDSIDSRTVSNAETEDEIVKNGSESPLSNEIEKFDYYNAEAFEQQAIDRLKNGAGAILSSGDVIMAVKELVMMAGEVRKFEEAQITVRSDIAARRDIAIASIEMQKEALIAYLDKSFDERKENFQALFSVVDDALERDNMQQLAMGLESVIKLAESSPFKDLRTVEATATALIDPDHEWDF